MDTLKILDGVIILGGYAVIAAVIWYAGFMARQWYQFNKAEKLKAAKPAWSPAMKYQQTVERFKSYVDAQENLAPEKPYDLDALLTCLHAPVQQQNRGGLDMLIKYCNRDGGRMERRVTVYGIGKFRGRHYVTGFCHLRNARRTFDIRKFKNSIDLNTGELIAKPMAYILARKPGVMDLTGEFEAVEQQRIANGYFG